MIVYHHSGQVKVQNRNWNLTLSVFWMMKTREDPEASQRRDRPATQLAPVRLLPIGLNRHHVLLISRSTGDFGAGCTTPGAIQLGGLSAPAVLGTEDPKRVERHAQSPPKHYPNGPECSTATERPDAN
jgi:hypothetical protein